MRHGYLVHSTGPWKKHIYVRKEGDEYIYPDDYRENLEKGKSKAGMPSDVERILKDQAEGKSDKSPKERAEEVLKKYLEDKANYVPKASLSSDDQASGKKSKGSGKKSGKSEEEKAAKEAAKAEKAAAKEQKDAERQAKKDAKDAKEKKAQDLIDKFREDVDKSGISAKNLFQTNSFSDLLEKYGIDADADEAKSLKSKLMKEFDLKSSYAPAKQEPKKKVKTRARPRKVSAITEPKVKAKVRTRTGLAHSDMKEGVNNMSNLWSAYSGELSHALVSRSRYTGGFIKKNGRSNNSSAYNHDYYIHNKEKWNENGKLTPEELEVLKKDPAVVAAKKKLDALSNSYVSGKKVVLRGANPQSTNMHEYNQAVKAAAAAYRKALNDATARRLPTIRKQLENKKAHNDAKVAGYNNAAAEEKAYNARQAQKKRESQERDLKRLNNQRERMNDKAQKLNDTRFDDDKRKRDVVQEAKAAINKAGRDAKTAAKKTAKDISDFVTNLSNNTMSAVNNALNKKKSSAFENSSVKGPTYNMAGDTNGLKKGINTTEKTPVFGTTNGKVNTVSAKGKYNNYDQDQITPRGTSYDKAFGNVSKGYNVYNDGNIGPKDKQWIASQPAYQQARKRYEDLSKAASNYYFNNGNAPAGYKEYQKAVDAAYKHFEAVQYGLMVDRKKANARNR